MAKRSFLDVMSDAIAQSLESNVDWRDVLSRAGGPARLSDRMGENARARDVRERGNERFAKTEDRQKKVRAERRVQDLAEARREGPAQTPSKGKEFAQGTVTKVESERKPASGATIAGYGDVMAKAKRLSAEQRAKPRAAPSPRPTPQESPAPRMPEMPAPQLAMAPDQAPERLFAPSQPAPVPIQGPGPRMAGPVAMPPTTQQAMASATVPSPGGTSPPAPPLGDAQQQFIQAGIAAGVFASAEEGHALLRSKVMMR